MRSKALPNVLAIGCFNADSPVHRRAHSRKKQSNDDTKEEVAHSQVQHFHADPTRLPLGSRSLSEPSQGC